MGQKSQQKTQQWLVIGVVIALIALAGTVFKLSENNKTQQQSATQQVVTVAGDNFCANNPSVDAKIRVRDALATTTQYLNATVYVKNLDANSISTVTMTSNSDYTSFSKLFDCKSVKGYELAIKSDGTYNSDKHAIVTADMLKRSPVQVDMVGTLYTGFKVRAQDNRNANAYLYAGSSTASQTGSAIVFNASTQSAFANTADVPIDVTFTFEPNTANEAKGTGTIFAIDTEDATHTTDFDETQAELWVNGVSVPQATGLSTNEVKALNTYELIYSVPDSIGMSNDKKVTEMDVRMKLQTESGQAKNYNPILKVVALGDYQSQKSGEDGTILNGIGFKNDVSKTELYSAQTVKLLVGSGTN